MDCGSLSAYESDDKQGTCAAKPYTPHHTTPHNTQHQHNTVSTPHHTTSHHTTTQQNTTQESYVPFEIGDREEPLLAYALKPLQGELPLVSQRHVQLGTIDVLVQELHGASMTRCNHPWTLCTAPCTELHACRGGRGQGSVPWPWGRKEKELPTSYGVATQQQKAVPQARATRCQLASPTFMAPWQAELFVSALRTDPEAKWPITAARRLW